MPTFLDWLHVQLTAVGIFLKMRDEEPEDDYLNSVEYHLGYRDALRRAMKFYKMFEKEVE